jgi:acetyl esterase
MTLEASVREFLATTPDAGSPEDTIAQRRAAILVASDELFDLFGEQADEVYEQIEHRIVRGDDSVRVRVYRPSDARRLPIHVFIHGGGFWLGSIDERVVDAACRERSVGADCIVVAVDYRLAPEHTFPTPVEDCYDALLWAHQHAEEFGGDPDNLSIGGVSAGANLAAAVCLAVRDRRGPNMRLQLLEVPPLDLTLETMRASGVGDAFGITDADMQLSNELYLIQPSDAANPLASPLLADNLAGLPAAHIMTAEFDPLRLEGERYAERLRAAGVAASHISAPGAVHGRSSSPVHGRLRAPGEAK